ncbi:MAG TPA: hypothetical protein VGO90_05970 [Chthoniobacteraceae bacterium]|nr:hypothetical protein [Chthoniobacteraceae bacterium]
MRVPTFSESLLRGVLGFTVVSVAGFAPWPIIGRWFRTVGEVGLYVACTAVFIGLSGICLHRLIIGPGSLSRFYKLFTVAFLAYAVAWAAVWMWLRGDEGSIGGLLAGTTVMGAILAFAFDAQRAVLKMIVALFVFNTLGYYAGGWVEGKLVGDHRLAGMLLWGVCYGIGFGAGLGIALHLCQQRARAALTA